MKTQDFTPDEVEDVLSDDNHPQPTEDPVSVALMRGDARGLTRAEAAEMIRRLTEGYGLNTMTSPVIFIRADKGLMVPYLTARGAAELRKRRGIEVVSMEVIHQRAGLVVMRATVRDGEGRTDVAIGAAGWPDDRPFDEYRAWMVAETRAKRRATMSAVGIFLEGPSDEVEGEAV